MSAKMNGWFLGKSCQYKICQAYIGKHCDISEHPSYELPECEQEVLRDVLEIYQNGNIFYIDNNEDSGLAYVSNPDNKFEPYLNVYPIEVI